MRTYASGFSRFTDKSTVSTSSFVAIAADAERKKRKKSDHPVLITRIVALVSTGSHSFETAFFPPVFKSRFLKILSSEIRRSNERIRRHDFEPITRFSFSARVNHYSEIYSLLFFYFYISEIYLVSSRLHGPSNFRTDSIP